MRLPAHNFVNQAAGIAAGYLHGMMSADEANQQEATQQFGQQLQLFKMGQGQEEDQIQRQEQGDAQIWKILPQVKTEQRGPLESYLLQRQNERAAQPRQYTLTNFANTIPDSKHFAPFKKFFSQMPGQAQGQGMPAVGGVPGMPGAMPGGGAPAMTAAAPLPGGADPTIGPAQPGMAPPGMQPTLPPTRNPRVPMAAPGAVPGAPVAGAKPSITIPGFGPVELGMDADERRLQVGAYQDEIRKRDMALTRENDPAVRARYNQEIDQLRQGQQDEKPLESLGLKPVDLPSVDPKAVTQTLADVKELRSKIEAAAGGVRDEDPDAADVRKELNTALAGIPSQITTHDELTAAQQWVAANRPLSLYANRLTRNAGDAADRKKLSDYHALYKGINPNGSEGMPELSGEQLAPNLLSLADLEDELNQSKKGAADGVANNFSGYKPELAQVRTYLQQAGALEKQGGQDNLLKARELRQQAGSLADEVRGRMFSGVGAKQEGQAFNQVKAELKLMRPDQLADAATVKEVFDRHHIGYLAPREGYSGGLQKEYMKAIDPAKWRALSQLKPEGQQSFLSEVRAMATALGKKVEVPASVALSANDELRRKLATLDVEFKGDRNQVAAATRAQRIALVDLKLQNAALTRDKLLKEKNAGASGDKPFQRGMKELQDERKTLYSRFFRILQSSGNSESDFDFDSYNPQNPATFPKDKDLLAAAKVYAAAKATETKGRELLRKAGMDLDKVPTTLPTAGASAAPGGQTIVGVQRRFVTPGSSTKSVLKTQNGELDGFFLQGAMRQIQAGQEKAVTDSLVKRFGPAGAKAYLDEAHSRLQTK